MPKIKGNDLLTAARMLEFSSPTTGWYRSLWCASSRTVLLEVLEASSAVQAGVLSTASIEELQNTAVETVGRDPGIGDGAHRKHIQEAMRQPVRPKDLRFYQIEAAAVDLENHYLKRWADQVKAGIKDGDIEQAARCIVSHLLDAGHSRYAVQERIRSAAFGKAASASDLHELVSDLFAMSRQPKRTYEALIPFSKAPLSRTTKSKSWLDGSQASQWLKNNCSISGVRAVGAIVTRVEAFDEYEAATKVREVAETVIGRVLIGSRYPLEHTGQLWLSGFNTPFPVERNRRGVEVLSLEREDRLYHWENADSAIDTAFNLLATLDEGPPPAAIASGWAAIESLLIASSESGDLVRAGDRIAAIAACSFPRAELTAIAYAHATSGKDALAAQLQGAATNRDRAELLAQALLAGATIKVRRIEEQAAVSRLTVLLKDPDKVLRRIQKYLARSLRRFYRQRNLVVHDGRTDGVALGTALRTVAPMVGAGIDRIHHAWITEKIDAIALAARSIRNLELLGSAHAKSVTQLLEP